MAGMNSAKASKPVSGAAPVPAKGTIVKTAAASGAAPVPAKGTITAAAKASKAISGAAPVPAKGTIRVKRAAASPAPAKGTRAVRVGDGALQLALEVARVPPQRKMCGEVDYKGVVKDVFLAGAGLPPSPNPFAPLVGLDDDDGDGN